MYIGTTISRFIASHFPLLILPAWLLNLYLLQVATILAATFFNSFIFYLTAGADPRGGAKVYHEVGQEKRR